ncbi:MAG: 30S ribosomal protein S17 [Candidatus Aenigmarchaeota archaeon ex4484_14]|nr:MAG: 30S ribosomal protein S17 [Candidatus Aenigmarchaeota archaeon ex4484_14]
MYMKDIGLGIKGPEKECDSLKCPWHGSLKVRGRTFIGKVVSDKGSKTVIVERSYNRFIKKYERFERRKTRIAAHNPDCIAAEIGDVVRIAECRPITKTKHFVVVEKINQKSPHTDGKKDIENNKNEQENMKTDVIENETDSS